jgi:type II secretory pathway component PulF
MPDFSYVARDAKGAKIEGRLTAQSAREVASVLAAKSMFLLKVQEEKAKQSLLALGRKGKVKGQIMAMTYNQLAALLRSGVPLLRSLNVLRDQSSNASLKDVLADVCARVEDGANIADAMARHPGAFSEMAVNMTRAGAEGGFLEDALERVAKFTEDAEDLKARTMGAMAYPVFLGCAGSVVVAVLLIFFVPGFAKMFDQLRERGELPVATEVLLIFSNFAGGWGLIVAALSVIPIIYAYMYLNSEKGRPLRDKWLLKLPMLGPILLSFAVARFCRVLGTLLKNGVPIIKSLEISSAAAGNRVLTTAITAASENVSSGQSLAAPLASSGHFPKVVIEMISVAEEANALDTVLVDIADNLEKRTTRRLDLAVRLLEPILLLVLAGIVLFVVIALLIPVIKMTTMDA